MRSDVYKMKQFFKRHAREIAFSGIALLCILLIGATLILLFRYSGGLEEQAVSRVENYSADTTTLLSQKIDSMNQKVHHAAERMASCTDISSLSATIQEILLISDYSSVIDLRFFKGDTEYNKNALPYDFDESDDVISAVGREGNGVVGVVYDVEHNVQSVVFYATLEDNALIDTVFFFYPISALSNVFDTADKEKLEKADFVALCSQSGEALRVMKSATGDLEQHNNIFEYVRKTVRYCKRIVRYRSVPCGKCLFHGISDHKHDPQRDADSIYHSDLPDHIYNDGATPRTA